MSSELQTTQTDQTQTVKKMKKRLPLKRAIAAAAALAVLGGAGFGVKALFFTSDEQTALTGTTTYGSLATNITGTATTTPADSFSVTPASSEYKIEAVYVSAGDTVAEGDLLYTQDDSELDDQLDDYQSQIDAQQESITSTNDSIADLQETLSKLTVSAPFAGRLTELTAEAGDEVKKGAVIAKLVDDSRMTLTEYFSYAYESEIYVGMTAELSIASLMNTFTGTVTDIQKVDRVTAEGTRCFAVTATVDNPGALTEGMTGAAWLTSSSGERLYPAVEGALEYNKSQDLTAKVDGTLTAVKGIDYQQVASGTAVATIDGSDYTDQIASLQTKLSSAQDKIVTLQERMAEVEEKRADYQVTSDIAGKVIMVNVRAGETPRSGMTAVSVYNMDTMEISANIDELQIDSIEMGMEVTVTKTSSDGAGERYTGTVSEISYEATNSDGVAYFPITVTIPAGGTLSAGVNVSYSIAVGDDEEGVLAPIAAVKTTDEGACLFVKADKRPEGAIDLEDGAVPDGFYAVPVEVGATNSQYARIVSGVDQGVEVFTRYQQSAPSNGDTTSTSGESTDSEQQWQGGGGMPSGMGGGMPGGGGGMGGGPMG